jgi:hypothetical protein
MPMRLGRTLLLALIGGAVTFVSWAILAVVFWMPYWHQLRQYGMYVHDFDAEQLIVFGPIVVVLFFFATIFLVASIEKKRFESGRPPPGKKWRILLLGALPGAVTFLLVTGTHRDAWRFPLSEAAVLVIGFALGSIWVLWRRADEGAAIAWFTTPSAAPPAPDRGRAS